MARVVDTTKTPFEDLGFVDTSKYVETEKNKNGKNVPIHPPVALPGFHIFDNKWFHDFKESQALLGIKKGDEDPKYWKLVDGKLAEMTQEEKDVVDRE